jgi:hypothetical protein
VGADGAACTGIADAMECFNIVVVRSGESIHHDAYANAAVQLCAGLRLLGYPARIDQNTLVWDATNIIVGTHHLEAGLADRLPPNTIIYNVEMVVPGSPYIREMIPFVRRFETWDYSEANIENWRRIGVSDRVRLLKPGYLPNNTRIDPATPTDIDALFYGTVNWRRDSIFADIARFGVRVHVASGIYGAERLALIARSKLVLNVHSREDSVLELGRICDALANRRAVVTDAQDLDGQNADLLAVMACGKASELGGLCRELLDDEPRRHALAEQALAAYARRDFGQYLRDLLSVRAESGAPSPASTSG